MSRISYRRASPENWERTVKRMVTLNQASSRRPTLAPSSSTSLTTTALRPRKRRAGRSEVERRLDGLHLRCRQGHRGHVRVLSCGRAGARRAAHHGGVGAARRDAPRLLPTGRQPADERRSGIPPHARRADGAWAGRPAARQPSPDGKGARPSHESASARDSRSGPSWSAAMQSPRLAGRWAVSGYQLGKGAVFGEMVVTADASAPDTFITDTRLRRRPHRRDIHSHGQGRGLHRLPVARPRRRPPRRRPMQWPGARSCRSSAAGRR